MTPVYVRVPLSSISLKIMDDALGSHRCKSLTRHVGQHWVCLPSRSPFTVVMFSRR